MFRKTYEHVVIREFDFFAVCAVALSHYVDTSFIDFIYLYKEVRAAVSRPGRCLSFHLDGPGGQNVHRNGSGGRNLQRGWLKNH